MKTYARFTSRLLLGTALLALVPGLAHAEAAAEAADADTAAKTDETIVVTGTLLRGIAPAGTNVIGVTAKDVTATGATTTSQLLQSVPQLGIFNDLQYPAGSGNSVTVNRPNLRNLPGNTTAGGSTTLVLMDGHRMVGAGVTSTTPDPDVIPPGAIERMEIVPDGGSAIYGADAVAGVINFVTRKKFDGVMVSGHFGAAKGYNQWDVDATAGKDWGSGGFYVSYNYSRHDRLTGRDRDFVQSFPDSTGLLSLICNPGNVKPAGSTSNYGLPGKVATPNQCDLSDDATFYPSSSRHSLFAAFTQDLSSSVKLDLRAYYTNRKMGLGGGTFRPQNGTTVTTASPFFAAHQIGSETSQTVTFAFGNADSTLQHIALDTWGITPTITADLGANWQLRLMGNHGESVIDNHQGNFNPTALTNAINAYLFNPYDPASSNPAALAIIGNYETYGHAKQKLDNVRAVIDGDLATLPGGAVKLAVGAEYFREAWKSQSGAIVPGSQDTGSAAASVGSVLLAPAGAAITPFSLSRNVKSVFGEVVVPFFGADNARAGFQELRLSLAGRYDHYSDHGDTFNPKIGLTWKPAEFLTLRGSWGKSFNAPSLADAPQADVTTLFVLPAPFFAPSGNLLKANGGTYDPPASTDIVYVRRGNSPAIKPQKADTWSLGADLTPASGVKLGITYWNIFVKGVIGLPNTTPSITYRDYPQVITMSPSTTFLNAVVAGANVFPFGPACHASSTPCNVYAFVDIAKNNVGDAKVSGLDINADFTHPTSFGSIGLTVNANYELTRKERTSSVSAWVDKLAANNSRFKTRTTLSAQVGDVLGQVVWNHTGGYKLDPVIGFVPQSSVSSYDVFNLFLRWDLKGEGMTKDLSLTLNVDNVFDKAPPVYRLPTTFTPGTSGFINGATIGRLFQFGLSKKF